MQLNKELVRNSGEKYLKMEAHMTILKIKFYKSLRKSYNKKPSLHVLGLIRLIN